MDKYPQALEGKTEIQTAREYFVLKDSRIEQLISELVPPVSIVYGPKRETQSLLRDKIKRMTGLGILIAQKHNDLKLLQTMKAYKSLAYKTTAYKLYENALQIAASIQQFSEDAVSFGFSIEEIEQFNTVVNDYGDVLTNTGYQLNDRKASRMELASLYKDCNKLLKDKFDPFALFVSELYPEFYREYSLLRISGGRKKTNKDSVAEQGEISGTISDNITGEPLEGVTVTIPGYDLVTVTDEDGFFVFSDLVTGTYKVTCSCQGYQVPAAQTTEITTNNLAASIDFGLDAVEVVVAA